jgi:hypothetical protein
VNNNQTKATINTVAPTKKSLGLITTLRFLYNANPNSPAPKTIMTCVFNFSLHGKVAMQNAAQRLRKSIFKSGVFLRLRAFAMRFNTIFFR